MFAELYTILRVLETSGHLEIMGCLRYGPEPRWQSKGLIYEFLLHAVRFGSRLNRSNDTFSVGDGGTKVAI